MSNVYDFVHQELVQTDPFPIPRHVYVIAEVGINHNGDVALAKRLIDLAKKNGCDAVKFQKRTIDIVYTAEELAKYRESPFGTTQREQKEGLEFGREDYDEIDRYCQSVGIDWFASAWDLESLEFLKTYGCPFHKVASAMATCREFVEAVAAEGRTTFLSTGMCTDEEVGAAVEIFRKQNCPVVLMHTVSEYPAAMEILNLQAIHRLREKFKLPVGYSGHEPNVTPSLIAATCGAVAIERHITVDRTMYGSDQAASLGPQGWAQLMPLLRLLPKVLGDGVRTITDTEKKVAAKLRYFDRSTGPR
jgi:N-acetylneuraminate synthase